MISVVVPGQSADTTLAIVCASYLFVFMSNSLDKTNTVTTQKKDYVQRGLGRTFCTCYSFLFFS